MLAVATHGTERHGLQLAGDLLGGRQSARTLHFLAATGLLMFVLVHVFEVIVSGVWNQLRSMVTGWYTLPADGKET